MSDLFLLRIFYRHSEGCANAVKRILGKVDGACYLLSVCSSGEQAWRLPKAVQDICKSSKFLFDVTLNEGVIDIQTNVEAKSVVVTHSESVSKQDMLEKLQKVRLLKGSQVVCLESISLSSCNFTIDTSVVSGKWKISCFGILILHGLLDLGKAILLHELFGNYLFEAERA